MNQVDKVLQALAQYDSCTLSDAIDSLGLPEVVSGLRRQSGTAAIVGRVITVQLLQGTPPPDTPKIHLGANAIALADHNNVIVIAHPGIDAGGWGGVLTRAAMQRGVKGVILDGATRDVDEANALNFPIYSKTVTAKTARGRLFEVSTNEPIIIAGCRVHPGDYTLADDSGIVFINPTQIEQVLTQAESIQARESLMINRLEKGGLSTDILGAEYEDMLESSS